MRIRRKQDFGRDSGDAKAWPARRLQPETRQGYILLCVVLWSVLSFMVTSTFLYSSVVVVGRSMEPTLHQGDRFVLNRWFHRIFPFDRGELVVVAEPGDDERVVKRVIALPSDTVHFEGGAVYVNGSRLSESYLPPGMNTYSLRMGARTLRLGPKQYFVMGDNRQVSEDSRYYGPVHRTRLLGVLGPAI